MADYLGAWMRMPDAGVERLGLSCVRMARHEIRWWYERFSEHELGPRFAKILDELDALEKLCSATSTTAQSAEASADQAGMNASSTSTTDST